MEEVWDKDMLMGKTGPMAGKGGADEVKKDPMLWGRAGYLTEEQTDVYAEFKAEIEKRDEAFKSSIYSFGEVEGEVWTLLRWCRARKFDLAEVVKMVEEATECQAEAKSNDFYRDPKAALGCDMALYLNRFPQLYSGYTKEGIPIFYSMPAKINIDAIEAITTVEGILKFHWFYYTHDFGERLRKQKKEVEGYHRFECFCIMDLGGLAVSQLSSTVMSILKQQAFIDSLCFPETMRHMVIINAPSFFSATWKIIKGFIDARTAGKVDVISSRKKWEERLKEFIADDQLPSDYGGTADSTEETMNKASPGDMKRLYTEILYVRGSNDYKTEIKEGEEVDVVVWTRSRSGGKFTIVDQDKASDKKYSDEVEVKFDGVDNNATVNPTSVRIVIERIKGPASIKVKCKSNASRVSSLKFLLAFHVYNSE